jgi:phosphohistidine phosphatase
MGELAMRIYLTQHGLAVPEDIDPDRPLSEQGRQDVRCLAEVLRQAGIRVERLFHSGKTRAEQTAAILAEPLLLAGQPQARSGLAPNDAVEPLSREIEAWARDTLIVGHLPFLGRLASLLVAGDPDRPTLAFQPGSLACLERDAAGHWVLLWMVRPGLINPARE